MPLFARRFSVPKFPARKAASMTNLSQLDATTRSQEFSLDLGPVRTRLSGRDLVFRDGNWVIEGDSTMTKCAGADRESFRMKKENHQLTEENNLLKLKIDILLDMLAETTAEVHLQENEIENLRNMLNRKSMPNVVQVS
ncbi:unnamed protein product [Echinostoma caproni]|uniref:Chibby family member 1, beta catenin antagonist n=1 Tax=Echinostoma caproni TaxID=27848 RepID=A0A183AM23_9TREM|nr:unnamed protein product [Echinostoma caproni]